LRIIRKWDAVFKKIDATPWMMVFSSKNHPATMPAMQQKWGWDQRRSLNLILDHQIWTEPNTKQESWSDPPHWGHPGISWLPIGCDGKF